MKKYISLLALFFAINLAVAHDGIFSGGQVSAQEGGCVITCPANIVRNNDPEECGANVEYPPPTISGDCFFVSCSPPSGNFFPVGTTTVICSESVGFGPSPRQIATCTFTITVIDNTPPDILCPPNITTEVDEEECSATVEYSEPEVFDNCGFEGPEAPRQSDCNPPSESSFPVGTTTVTCTATDDAGNTASCSFTITVTEEEEPSITCPPDQVVAATTATGAQVNYPPPSASDSCPGVQSSCTPPSGSFFPVGSTDVQCTATDASGNTDQCSFTVTVTEQGECVITCPQDVTVNSDPNRCGTVVEYSVGVPAGCEVICSPPSASFFTVGTTTVTCTVQGNGNGNGNQGQGQFPSGCSFNVTVIDTSPPSITCPGNITTSVRQGQRTAVVDFVPATATDACGPTSVICLPPSGTAFPLGISTVTCTASDRSGNRASCTFEIRVQEGIAPTISCPANIRITPTSSQCSNVVNFATPTVSGGTGNTTVVCTPPSGATFPVGTTAVNCTATDVVGNSATCSFSVTIDGTPQIVVSDSLLEFGVADPPRKRRNNPPGGCDCEETFTIQNTGCGPLTLTLSAIMRMGRNVDNGKITNTDDSRFFSVRLVNPATDLNIGSVITIPVGETRTFRVIFNPEVPGFSGKTSNLAASEVLPEEVESKLVFTRAGGDSVIINLLGRVSDRARLINPDNPRKGRQINFTRNGNEFEIVFAVFDSDLSVSRARIEFLNSNGDVVTQPFDFELEAAIEESNIIEGQSFRVVIRFTGANTRPDVVSVRVTIFDGNSSDTDTARLRSSSSSQAISLSPSARRGLTIFLPVTRLDQ